MAALTEQPVAAHLVGRYLRGTATFIYQYITNMRRYTPVVLATFGEDPERFPFADLHIPKLSRWQTTYIKAYRRLYHRQPLVEPFFRQIIQDRSAKVLHAHFGTVGVFSLPLREATGLPLVTTFYGFDMSAFPKKPRWHRSYQRLFSEGDLFLVEGSHMREQLIALGCPEEKVQIQRIGVDLGGFFYRPSPPRDECVRILMCGRFVEKKGFEYGVRAFAQIRHEFPKAQLRIVGDGPLRPGIEQLVREHELAERVLILGSLPYDAYAEEADKAHILLAPSVTAANGDSEGGAPTVLLEMQARGLSILSTYHADIPEVVADKVSGYLVPERDVEALSEKLVELLAHPEQWDEMGQAGRAHMEKKHDIVSLARELEGKYDAVLER